MCYRCNVCQRVSKPKQPRLVHTIYRTRPETVYQEIAKEIPICWSCHQLLADGVPFNILTKQEGRIKRIPACSSEFDTLPKRPVISFD